MFRKLFALLPLAACLISANASAVSVDQYGTGTDPDPDDWNAPKVAPSTVCQSLMLFLADVPNDATSMRRYRFTGTCTINTARQGKLPKMKTVDVLVDAEYSPRLKRASERVVVKDPDLGMELSTWATCPNDPFVGTSAACTNKGMGANKFDKFINKDDAPFAHQRASASQVSVASQKWALAKQRGATPTSFYEKVQVHGLVPIAKTTAGTNAQVILNLKGGAGYCPSELDFGDGTKQRMLLWSSNIGPYQHTVEHAFAKPGFYKVTLRSLPGCEGEHLAYALVK
ncbi:MAG: hypothetical protein U0270_39665 [Labilithrix sp.]